MSTLFELEAETRTDEGKGASRRLRRLEDKIPAIVYGGKKQPLNIKIAHNKILHAIENEAFFSHILTLKIDGKDEKVVIKDLQRHHYKPHILHADFQRISAKQIITMNVPLHFINEDKCPGVKKGGLITHHMIDVEVKCPADKLPEFIEVDLSTTEIEQAIHLSDLKLPADVKLTAFAHGDKDHDITIASVHKQKGAATEEETATDAKAEEKKEEK